MFDKLESVVLEIPNQSIFCCLNHRPLWDKYPDIISRYTPFVLLSMAQGKVIIDDNRETHRCEMRDARHLDAFCYEDDLFEQFHNEAFLDFVDPFKLREAEEFAERKELQRLRKIEKVRIVLSMMKPAQERRLYKFVIEGKSCCEIAVEEGTYHSSAEPVPGMIIFFDWDNKGSSGAQDGESDHVGIVEKVENSIVYTVEGNSGDSCRINQYSVGHYEILGYGVPAY